MATLYVTEFADTYQDVNSHSFAMAKQPPVAKQTVAIGAGSTQSSAVANNTTYVRLFTDTACGIEFGTNPTAGASSSRMAANSTEYFAVPLAQAYKVAVITP